MSPRNDFSHVRWTCSTCNQSFWVPEFVQEPNLYFCGCKAQTEFPPMRKQMWNVARALAAFVANPRFVAREEYVARLDVCHDCDQRRDERCLQCGCALSLKARGAAFDCPLRKWQGAIRKSEGRIS
jgi:hypothetical protein